MGRIPALLGIKGSSTVGISKSLTVNPGHDSHCVETKAYWHLPLLWNCKQKAVSDSKHTMSTQAKWFVGALYIYLNSLFPFLH